MQEDHVPFTEIRQIIAADQRCCEVTPENDQVWELDTSRGEPPALALQTTYGLRAYGMRVFPRFIYNKVPVSDPRAFVVHPSVAFSAPNFVELDYSPIHFIDVNQKVWVPNSHTLVGLVTLTNTSESMLQFGMEWVAQLNPLVTGSHMSAEQISVNTVLQGQSGHLHPVFFLTGGPQASLSAFPSLGIQVALTAHSSRQFSWALASLESTDASFYEARKSTAYSLDNEQVKLQMQLLQQTIGFDFGDSQKDSALAQSQRRVFQLLLPPYKEFNHVSCLVNRLPDQGYHPPENEKGTSNDWGVQRIMDLFEISRMLLPARPDLVKGLLQNVFDQQAGDGRIHAQTGWNGSITSLAAAPLSVSLALDLFEYTQDIDWLAQIYPALIRSVRVWFEPDHDRDSDGWPEWDHLLQTGLLDSSSLDPQTRSNLEEMIRCAEWPDLAALLFRECQGLIKMARLVEEEQDLAWLEDRVALLQEQLQDCWDDRQAIYRCRDHSTHAIDEGKILHRMKQDGSAEIRTKMAFPSRICVKITPRDGGKRQVECTLRGVCNRHEKKVVLSAKEFDLVENTWLVVTKEVFSTLKQVSVTGLKKGDLLLVETPDFALRAPDFMIPLWAGVPSVAEAEKMILQGCKVLDAAKEDLPSYLKIMWLEGLLRYNRDDLAGIFYQKWFFSSTKNLPCSSLHNQLPILPLLQILGIHKIGTDMLELEGFNQFFPKVNVQYRRIRLALDAAQTVVTDLNGESVTITDPAAQRIVLS